MQQYESPRLDISFDPLASPLPGTSLYMFSSCPKPQSHPSHTHQNSRISAAKNATHAFHPTPVFLAILSILFIVPLILFLLFSNWSFIFSARVVESRISSPMRCVNYEQLAEL